MRYWAMFLSFCVFMTACNSKDPDASNSSALLRLVSTGAYLDGGTVYFVLVDAKSETLRGGFDGRMRTDDSICPSHSFVGGNYPTAPGVRLLPLWGDEERKLIALLSTVVSEMVTPAELQTFLEAKSGAEIPSKFHDGRWGFIRAVEGRRRTLEAIDQGLLAGTVGPGRLFGGADTSHVESLIREFSPERFVLTFPSANGDRIRIGFPASLDSAMSPALFAGKRFESRYLAGSWVDRKMVTYVMKALERDSALVNPRDRTDLLKVLERRRVKILEADKGC